MNGWNREDQLDLRRRVAHVARTGLPSWGVLEDLVLSICSGRHVEAHLNPWLGDGSRGIWLPQPPAQT